MAKSGQKRAFEDETVQDRLPKEELRLTDRSAPDLSSTIAAAEYGQGFFPSPSFWNDLVAISRDVHDTYRTVRTYDAMRDNEKYKIELSEANTKLENTLKLNNDIEYGRQQLDIDTRLQDLIETERRNGNFNTLGAIDKFRTETLDNLQKMALNGNLSPYLSDKLYTYADNTISRKMVDAINYDAAVAEKRADYSFGLITNTSIQKIYTENMSVEEAMEYSGHKLGPLRKAIMDNDDDVKMNTTYNAFILAEGHRILDAQKHGDITAEEGRNLIKELISRHTGKQMYWEVPISNSEEDEGKTDRVPVSMDAKTLQSLELWSAQMKDNTKDAIDASFILDQYKSYIGYENLIGDNPDYTKAAVLTMYNLPQADAYFQQDVSIPLARAAASGNVQAAKDLYQARDIHYRKTRPLLFIKDTLSTLMANGYGYNQAVSELQKRVLSVQNKILSGDDLSYVSELTFTDNKGQQLINLGVPKRGDNEDFDAVYRQGNVPERTARVNFYNDVIKAADGLLSRSNLSDILQSINGDYKASLNEVKIAGSPTALVYTDASDTSIVRMSDKNANELAQKIKQSDIIQKGLAGDQVSHMSAKDTISYVAQQYKTLDTKQQVQYLKAWGRAVYQAGNPDYFTGFALNSLTKEEQEVAKTVTMWAYLDKAEMGTYAGLIEKNMLSDNPISSLNPDYLLKGDIGGKLEKGNIGKVKPTASDDSSITVAVEQTMTKHNIKPEYQPYVRNMLTQMAVSEMSTMKEKSNKFNNFKMANWDIALDRLFDNGIPKNAPKLRDAGIDTNQASALQTNIKRATNSIYNKFKINNNEITVDLNANSGYVDINIAGQRGVVLGRNSSDTALRGQTFIPLSICYTNKPADMEQGKYEKSVVIQAGVSTGLLPFNDINSRDVTQKIVNKNRYGKQDNNYYQELSLQLVATAANREVQDEYIQWRNSDYRNQSIPPAPIEFKKMVWEAMSLNNKETASSITKDEAERYLDFLYSKRKNRKTIPTANSTAVEWEAKGVPYVDIQERARQSTWTISEGLRNPNSELGRKNPNSAHIKGLAADFTPPFNSYNASGKIKPEVLDKFINFVVKPDKQRLNGSILTTYNEIFTDSAYAKYKRMTLSDGKTPLFKSHDGYYSTGNHMHVTYKDPIVNPKTGLYEGVKLNDWVRMASGVIQKDVSGTAGNMTPEVSRAIATLFHHYNVTQADANLVGQPISSLNNPLNACKVVAYKFLLAENALGPESRSMIWAGLFGAKFNVELSTGDGGLEKSVKVPKKKATLDEIISLSRKGYKTSNGKMKLSIDPDDKLRYHLNDRWGKLKKMGAL